MIGAGAGRGPRRKRALSSSHSCRSSSDGSSSTSLLLSRRGCYLLTVAVGLLQLCLFLGTGWRFAAFLRWQQQEGEGGHGRLLPFSPNSRLRGAPGQQQEEGRPAYAALSAGGLGAGSGGGGMGQQQPPPPPAAAARHRVAVLIPFLGRDFPPWFRAFADACGAGGGEEGGAVVVDWVILHEGARCVFMMDGWMVCWVGGWWMIDQEEGGGMLMLMLSTHITSPPRTHRLPPGYTPPVNVRLVDLGPDGT